MKKGGFKLNAARLRIVLIATIGLFVVLSGAGFYLFQGTLTALANEVNTDNLTAAASSKDVQQLQNLKREMEDNQIAMTRAKKIVADSQYYQYQNQIIDDLTSYANDAGFSLNGFGFSSNQSGAATTPAATSAAAATAPTLPAGLKATNAQITFPKYVDFAAYMNFLKSIEQNLTKMEIQGVSLKVDPTNGGLEPDPLSIEVYVK